MCTLFKTSICCPNKPKAQIKYEMVMLTTGYRHFNFSRTFFIIRSYSVKKCGKIKLTQNVKKCGKIQTTKNQKVRENENSNYPNKKMREIQNPIMSKSAERFKLQKLKSTEKLLKSKKYGKFTSIKKSAVKFKFLYLKKYGKFKHQH